MTLHPIPLNFLLHEENCLFFFITVTISPLFHSPSFTSTAIPYLLKFLTFYCSFHNPQFPFFLSPLRFIYNLLVAVTSCIPEFSHFIHRLPFIPHISYFSFSLLDSLSSTHLALFIYCLVFLPQFSF